MTFFWNSDVYRYKVLKCNWFSSTYRLIFNSGGKKLGITLNWAPRVVVPYTDKSLIKVIKKAVRKAKFKYWLVSWIPAKYGQKICPYHKYTEPNSVVINNIDYYQSMCEYCDHIRIKRNWRAITRNT